MNLIETLDNLDKLILNRSSIAEIRAIIHSIREHVEAHSNKSDYLTYLDLKNNEIVSSNDEIVSRNSEPVAENSALKPKPKPQQRTIPVRFTNPN